MKRAVSGASGAEAGGQCFGLTVPSTGMPHIAIWSKRSAELVKMVTKQIAEIDDKFTFTSLQVVLNARAQMHTDKNIAARR